jgi:phosphopantothenoylcysteine decarboxylase/phosphopantothenate--cysteine ligase
MLNGKKILLGVCGGIAAYKAVALCSRLVQAGARVRVVMTESATKFVTPLTFQTMSREAVATDTFEERDPSVVSHIELADWADAVVIAPATANMLAKMAVGLADDMLSTVLLATEAPVWAAPAMNVHMLDHPAVRHNLALLAERGVRFIEPGEGQLACGYVGKGRMAEPEQIMACIEAHFRAGTPLAGKTVLISAGGTVERIDPVRYISNDSSGKMGYALARSAASLGARVVLLSANVRLASPPGVNVVKVVSAQDMYDAALARLPEADIVIMAAAVADYRPVRAHAHKIKKSEDRMVLELEKTPDILSEIGRRKGRRFVVGFAAETEHLEQYAMDKLVRKRCDLVVANDVSLPGGGFGSDQNEVKVFDHNGLVEQIPLMSKDRVADRLMALIADRAASSRGEA